MHDRCSAREERAGRIGLQVEVKVLILISSGKENKRTSRRRFTARRAQAASISRRGQRYYRVVRIRNDMSIARGGHVESGSGSSSASGFRLSF